MTPISYLPFFLQQNYKKKIAIMKILNKATCFYVYQLLFIIVPNKVIITFVLYCAAVLYGSTRRTNISLAFELRAKKHCQLNFEDH